MLKNHLDSINVLPIVSLCWQSMTFLCILYSINTHLHPPCKVPIQGHKYLQLKISKCCVLYRGCKKHSLLSNMYSELLDISLVKCYTTLWYGICFCTVVFIMQYCNVKCNAWVWLTGGDGRKRLQPKGAAGAGSGWPHCGWGILPKGTCCIYFHTVRSAFSAI